MAGSRWKIVGTACAGLLVAFALGWWAGRTSFQSRAIAEASVPVEAHAPPSVATTTADTSPAGETTAAPEYEGEYADLISEVTEQGTLARAALLFSGDPSTAIAKIVNNMSDRELIAAISSISDFAGRDIRKSRDMRRYATRLSEIALDGIVDGPSSGAGEVDIEFSTSVGENHSAPDAQERFGPNNEKLYAVFPNGELPDGPILLKWSRTDQPELLLFEKYAVNRRREHSYVWFKPQEGFPPGEYQVDFYSADGELDHLGAGSYSVDPEPSL